MGLWERLKSGLRKTREILSPLAALFTGRKLDEGLLSELEDALILADVGPKLSIELCETLRQKFKKGEMKDTSELRTYLKKMLSTSLFTSTERALRKAESGTTVIFMIGVNGTGKTTTTAKLAKLLKSQGNSVMLAAADTFRAAAGEQLDIWANRVGVEIVRHSNGADPAAVVFDACEAAVARKIDYVLVDTAGRLHTKDNLMRQLEKIHRIAGQKIAGSPHDVLLVLDATTGQNALSQARLFASGVGITGLVLTKLDGTAKGGIALAIHREIQIPIKYVGFGEKEDDFSEFDPDRYLDALL